MATPGVTSWPTWFEETFRVDVAEVIVGLSNYRIELMTTGAIVHWLSRSTQTKIILARTDFEGIEVLVTSLMAENKNLRMAVVEFVRSHKKLKYLLKETEGSSPHSTIRSMASTDLTFRQRLITMNNQCTSAEFPKQWSSKSVSRKITPARALVPRMLPPRQACFGRDAQLSRIERILDQDLPPVVVLYGTAGIGKTTIALASMDLSSIKARYGVNRIWINCSTAVPGIEGFLQLVFIGLGHKPNSQPNQTITQLFTALERGGKVLRPLIVLDHFESIWDRLEVREEIQGALDSLSELATIMITTKHQDFPVFQRGHRPIDIRTLDLRSARQTFLHHRPQFESVGQELNEFLRELDYYPLAIRLVASTSSPSDKDVRRLKIRWKGEQARWSKAEDKEASALDLAISYSIHSKILDPADSSCKRLCALQMIASVPDGLDGATIGTLLQADEFELQKALDGGVRTSLISEEPGSRYRMLAPIREYISSRYPLSVQQRAELHDYYLSYLEARSLEVEYGNEKQHKLLELVKEEVNLDFIISDALHSASEETCLRAIWMVSYGPMSHSPEVISAAAKRAGELSELNLQIDCLRHFVSNGSTNLKSQYKHLETAVDIFRQVGTLTLDRVDCMEQFGDVLFALKWPTSAKTEYLAALEILQNFQDQSRQASILFKLGQLHFLLIPDVNFSESLKYFTAALAIQRDLGDTTTECLSFLAISECFVKLENFDAALAHLDRAILLSQTAKQTKCAEQYSLEVRRLRIMRLKRDLRSTEPYISRCMESFRTLDLSMPERAQLLNELGHLSLIKGSNMDKGQREAVNLWDCADFLMDYSLFEPRIPADVDFSDIIALKRFISSRGSSRGSSSNRGSAAAATQSWSEWFALLPPQPKEGEAEDCQEPTRSGTLKCKSWYQGWLEECIGWHTVHKRFENAQPWWEVCKLSIRLRLYEARLAKEKGRYDEAHIKFGTAGENLAANSGKLYGCGPGISEYYPEDERLKCHVMAEACRRKL